MKIYIGYTAYMIAISATLVWLSNHIGMGLCMSILGFGAIAGSLLFGHLYRQTVESKPTSVECWKFALFFFVVQFLVGIFFLSTFLLNSSELAHWFGKLHSALLIVATAVLIAATLTINYLAFVYGSNTVEK